MCDVSGCLKASVKKISVAGNTVAGSITKMIGVCSEHLTSLGSGCRLGHSMGCKTKDQKVADLLGVPSNKGVLTDSPSSEELLPYVSLNIRKKKIRRKFLKNPMFYKERLPKRIVSEYTNKLLCNSLSTALKVVMNRDGIARRTFLIETVKK